MTEMLEELKKLNEKLETTLQASHEARKLNDEMREDMAKKDTTLQDAVKKAAEAMEQAQGLKLKLEAVEKTAEYVEKAISRLGTSENSENSEMEKRAAEETARYLRKGTAVSTEVSEAVVRSMCEKSFHGIPDHVRESEIKTLIAGSNPDGGYFIRPERSTQMVRRIFESSPIRSIANITTTSSDVLEMIIDDEEAASGGWVGETSSRGTTGTPTIGLLSIPVQEQFAQPPATQKMLDDAGFDIESWLSGKVTRKITRVENTAFVNGDGSQKPQGFLVLPAWTVAGTYQRKAIEQINSGSAGNFTADGIKALQNSLIEEYQAGAVFGIKRASFENIITLKDGQGQYLLNPRSMKEGDNLMLLGKRVIFMNDMPDVAADALALVYGDFSVGYTVVDRMGFRVIRDNVTEKPNTLFYTTKRVGGAVTNFEALKIQKLAA